MTLPNRPILSEIALRQKGYHQVSRVPSVFCYRDKTERDRTTVYLEDRRRKNVYFCCWDGETKYVDDLDFSRANREE
jgi:hypothetical protein